MELYQWTFGHQPHYVVAMDYADAEVEIKNKYGRFTKIDRIDCLGPYVTVSAAAGGESTTEEEQ